MDPADVIDLKDVAVTALEESFTARNGRIRGMLLPPKKSVPSGKLTWQWKMD